jgi:Cu-Zn family superoxide dismutase
MTRSTMLISTALAALTMAAAAAPAWAQAAAPAAPGMAKAHLQVSAPGVGEGDVTFEEMGDGLMMHVVASGLPPGSTHGFHVHDKGVCTGPDFTSAGGHFNPTAHAHGGPDAERHAGDMPNVVADASGKVDQRVMLHGSMLRGAEGVVGHAVVLHAGADDYKTQPTGNSGARMACGVITE